MIIPETIKANAISLQNIGVNDVAWLRSDALELLKTLEGSAIAVLGGDVLKKVRENYKYNYDHWSSDIKPGEQWAAYAARSRKETQDYIESYPDNGNGEYIYCLIFTEKPTLEQLQKMNEC
jgi:hypothetical protein